MKYVDEDGNPISGFFDVNQEIDKGKKRKVCMNPECKEVEVLVKHKCEPTRPLIYLGKKCWNCKQVKYLEDYNGKMS